MQKGQPKISVNSGLSINEIPEKVQRSLPNKLIPFVEVSAKQLYVLCVTNTEISPSCFSYKLYYKYV